MKRLGAHHRAGTLRNHLQTDRFTPAVSGDRRKETSSVATFVTVPRCRRGVVLIIVLVLVVMIALAGFGFVAEMTTEYEASKINGDLVQAEQVMASAETYLLAHVDRLRQSPGSPRTPATENPVSSGDAASRFQAVTLSDSGDTSASAEQSRSDTEWRFAVVKDLSEFDAAHARRRTGVQAGLLTGDADLLGDVNLEQPPEFGLCNESSKLNLGRVLHWDTVEPGRGRRALTQIPGVTDAAADAILDWIDSDDIPRPLGAEASEYRQQRRGVQPRNSIPETLTELLFIQGVDRSAYFGTDSLTESQAAQGWGSYLTVTSAESNNSVPPRIALGRLAASELSSVEADLAGVVPEEIARYVTLALMFGISSSSGQLQVAGPLEVPLSPVTAGTTVRAAFELPDLIDSFVLVAHSSSSRAVASPISSEDPASLQAFALLEQRVTTADTTLAAVRGRINILTADEVVLRALTDDPVVASQIVQQRESLTDEERQSSVWLLTRRIIDVPTYRNLYADITMGGDVYSAEIVVYRAVGGPFLRRRITVDAASGAARRTHWQDLSSEPLPLTFRQLEPSQEVQLFE